MIPSEVSETWGHQPQKKLCAGTEAPLPGIVKQVQSPGFYPYNQEIENRCFNPLLLE